MAALRGHADFTLANPNRVRSLFGVFAQANPLHLHRADGAGYALLADVVVELDPRNPQVAARLVSGFNEWLRYDTGRQELIKAQLDRIAGLPSLSKDVYEIVARALSS